MSEKMPILILMPVPAEQPPAEPAEPEPKLNPKDWNQVYRPGVDKNEHAIAGVVIGLGAFFLGETVLEGIGLSKKGALIYAILFAVTAVLGIMFGKEVWDSLGHGCADIWDMICGILPFLCVILPIIIAYAYITLKKAEKGGKE